MRHATAVQRDNGQIERTKKEEKRKNKEETSHGDRPKPNVLLFSPLPYKTTITTMTTVMTTITMTMTRGNEDNRHAMHAQNDRGVQTEMKGNGET